MRQSAIALARTRGRVRGGNAWFERLEERGLLTAPTLTPLAPIATVTQLVLPIQYHSDSPIDLTTIGNGDIGVSGPAGFSQLAHLLGAPTVLSNGDVLARYAVSAPGGQWSWPSANGTYTV